MTITNMHEAKTQFSKLIARVQEGEEIIVGKAGKSVAKIVPFEHQVPRIPGALKGKIKIADDFDFETLPIEIADAFGISAK